MQVTTLTCTRIGDIEVAMEQQEESTLDGKKISYAVDMVQDGEPHRFILAEVRGLTLAQARSVRTIVETALLVDVQDESITPVTA